MKINKCPFCGGEDADVDCTYVEVDPCNDMLIYFVVCSCGAMGKDMEIKEDAIMIWNIVSEKYYA